jgi:hypothetical protein
VAPTFIWTDGTRPSLSDTAAEDRPGLAQVIDLLQHVAAKGVTERRDTQVSTFVTLSLDELMILVTEVSRSIFEQLAANLMLRTPEEVAALREQIQQLQGAEPMEAKDAGRAERGGFAGNASTAKADFRLPQAESRPTPRPRKAHCETWRYSGRVSSTGTAT